MTSNPPLLTFTWYKRQIYMITFLVSLHFIEKNVWRKIWYGQNCSINQTQPRKYFGSCSLMFWRFYVINNRERYGTMLQNFLVQCHSCCYFYFFILYVHIILCYFFTTLIIFLLIWFKLEFQIFWRIYRSENKIPASRENGFSHLCTYHILTKDDFFIFGVSHFTFLSIYQNK